jgi:soluble lytic murein transglycosylase-like protein
VAAAGLSASFEASRAAGEPVQIALVGPVLMELVGPPPPEPPPAPVIRGDRVRVSHRTRDGKIWEIQYRVAPGDSLSTIAARFDAPIERLVVANGLRNRHRIRAEQWLQIPLDMWALEPDAFERIPATLRRFPERVHLAAHFERWAREYDIEPDLLKALGWIESRWRPNAVSHRGAIGIGQLMPATVDFVSTKLVGESLDPWRPDQNIKMSAAFLRYLLDATDDDPRLALAAYYQGLGAVRSQGVYPRTQPYVDQVLAARSHFAAS